MKNMLCFQIAALLVFMVGCQSQVPVKSLTHEPNPDPVDFTWIRNSEEIKLLTANIYFKGIAEGKYIEDGKWTGKITGDIFCKPKPEKLLKGGLYIQGCTIQVNEDCSINILAPEDLVFIAGKKIYFENGEVVVVGDAGNGFKAGGMMTVTHSTSPPRHE